MSRKRIVKQSFTLVEIIAVLIIIGIMSAVAIPRFINLGSDAEDAVLTAGLSEAKSGLSVAYAKAYLDKRKDGDTTQVSGQDVIDASGYTEAGETFGDVTVSFDATDQVIDLEASIASGTTKTDSWTVPDDAGN